jgi:hypothetical protein
MCRKFLMVTLSIMIAVAYEHKLRTVDPVVAGSSPVGLAKVNRQQAPSPGGSAGLFLCAWEPKSMLTRDNHGKDVSNANVLKGKGKQQDLPLT